MSEIRTVTTKAGEAIPYATSFEENIRLRTDVPEKTGTVERIEYDTAVYGNGRTYHKYAYVYLPYCYDPDDSSRKYNVVYFQHGNTCDPDMFAAPGIRFMFDMLFDSGELEPCIIVFVSYYMDPMRDAEIRARTGGAEAGDGWTPGIPPHFDREIVQDVIPAVETRFRTYLEDASGAGIRATRDHRAFSGYSRGSAWTWRMFRHAFPYFRWYCPTSGGISCDTPLPMPPGSAPFPSFTDAEILDYMTAPLRENPGLPCFIYAACGGARDTPNMPKQIRLLIERGGFSYGAEPAKNNLYFSMSDFYHTDYLVPYYFWNFLKVLFRL